MFGRNLERHWRARFLIAECAKDGSHSQFVGADNGLNDSRRAQRVAEIRLQALHGAVLQFGQRHGFRLHFVVVDGGRAVGVHKTDVGGLHASLAHCPANGQVQFVARARRARYVVGVVADGAASQQNAVLVVVWRQQHGTRALAKVQSVAARVERHAALAAQRFERFETACDEVGEHVAARHNHALVHASLNEPLAHNHCRKA